MNAIVAAIVLFALAAWTAAGTRDGVRNGAMPFVWLGGINPLVVRRDRSPGWFRVAMTINVVLATALAFAAILLLAHGTSR